MPGEVFWGRKSFDLREFWVLVWGEWVDRIEDGDLDGPFLGGFQVWLVSKGARMECPVSLAGDACIGGNGLYA